MNNVSNKLQKALAAEIQEAFPAIPVSPSTGLAMHERDTHFQGFADLLIQELQEIGLLESWNPDFGEIDQEKEQQAVHLIAQRAYDLIEHTLQTVNLYMLDGTNPLEWAIESVPDMTAWPDC